MKKFLTRVVFLSAFMCLFLEACAAAVVTVSPSYLVRIDNGEAIVEFRRDETDKNEIYRGKFDGKYLSDLLKELGDEQIIDVESQNGAYGEFLTKVGDLEAGKEGSFIAIYTDMDGFTDTTNFAKTIKISDSVSVTTAGSGAASLPLKDGTAFLIKLENIG